MAWGSKLLSYLQTEENRNSSIIPDTESLKDTFKRVIPYYEKNILPILKKEKNVIISAHGNSLRSLCKK